MTCINRNRVLVGIVEGIIVATFFHNNGTFSASS